MKIYSKKNLIIIFVFLAIVIILALFLIRRANTILVPAPGGQYKEGLTSQPEFNNPLISERSQTDALISRLVFSSLVKRKSNSEVELDLLSKYEINADQSYTFYLSPDVFWHDQKKLTVDDVIFTINLAKSLSNDPILSSLTVSKIDDYSFKATCPYQSYELLPRLDFPILPQHIWENISRQDLNDPLLNVKPLGSGPFVFQDIELDNQGNVKTYTLKRNENFSKKKPYLESITFVFYPDIEKALEGLLKQEIQGLGFLSKNISLPPDLSYNHHIYKLNLPQYLGVFFNLDKEKFSLPVRQALNILIKKEEVPPVLAGMGLPIQGPILNNYLNGEKEKISSLTDKERQEQFEDLLASDGWAKTVNGWQKNGEILEISLITGQDTIFQEIANFLKQTWEKQGLKVNINLQSAEEISRLARTGDFQVLLYGVLAGLPSQQYAFWHSSLKEERTNLTGFSHREVDRLLELASLAEEKDEKYDYLQQAEELIINQQPAIFLYSPYYIYIIRDNIKGVQIEKNLLSPQDRFFNIEDWYIKTSRQPKKEQSSIHNQIKGE